MAERRRNEMNSEKESLFPACFPDKATFKLNENTSHDDHFEKYTPPFAFAADSPLWTPNFEDLSPMHSPLKAMPVSSPEEAQPNDEVEAIQLENLGQLESEETPEIAFDGVSYIPTPPICSSPLTQTIRNILRESAPVFNFLDEEEPVKMIDGPIICESVTKTAAPASIRQPKSNLQVAPSDITPKAPVDAPVDAFPATKIRISRIPSTKEFKVTPIVQPKVQPPRQNEDMAPIEELLAHIERVYRKVVPFIHPIPDTITGQMPPARYEPRLKPVDGIVKPPVMPPPNRPGRVTNQLVFMREKVLPRLIKLKAAELFRTSVDAIALQIPEYHHEIRFPMDLETISARLRNGYYWSAREATLDIYLMLANCYAFNQPGDFVSTMGKRLESSFETAMKGLPQQELLMMPQEQKTGLMRPKENKYRKVEETTQFRDRREQEVARLEHNRPVAIQLMNKDRQKDKIEVPVENVAKKRKGPPKWSKAKRVPVLQAPKASTSKVPERAQVPIEAKEEKPLQSKSSVGRHLQVTNTLQRTLDDLSISDDDDEENDPVLLSLQAKRLREEEERAERQMNLDSKKQKNVRRSKKSLKPFSVDQMKRMTLRIGLLPLNDLIDIMDLIHSSEPSAIVDKPDGVKPGFQLNLSKLSTRMLNEVKKFLDGCHKTNATVLQNYTLEQLVQRRTTLETRLAEINSKLSQKSKSSAMMKESTGQQGIKVSKQQKTDSSSEGSSSSSESSSGSSSESSSESQSESESESE